MAEITAQKTAEELYNKLSPMEKQQYDGVFGMAGFKERYEKDPTSQFVLGDVNYGKFKAIADAQAAAPQESFLDKINIFSSASAAEPDIGLKLAGDVASKVSSTPGFETVLNPNGTISIVPVDTSSSLPFNVGSRLFDQFNNAGAVPNVATEPYISPTYLMKQQLGMVPTGITASSAAQNVSSVPFGTSVDNIQGFTDKEDFSRPEEKTGIAKLFDFLQKFSPSGLAVKGLNALGSMLNFKDSPMYRPATIGVGGYTPEQLNRMNALGGYYSEPMIAYRRNAKSLSNMLRRAAADKSFSKKRLRERFEEFGLDPNTSGGMIDSIRQSSKTGYGGYGSREAAASAAASGGRDYSSSPGAMAGDMEYGEE
jgi:hypothetical protein